MQRTPDSPNPHMEGEAEEAQKKPENPLITMGFGVAVLFLAYFLHKQFTELETGVVESIRMNVIVIMAYKTIGHWPTVVLTGIGGLFLITKGFRKLGTTDPSAAASDTPSPEQSEGEAAPVSMPTADKDIFVCRVETPEGAKDYVTPLPADIVQKNGVPEHAMIGVLTAPLKAGERITPAKMVVNAKFADSLHRFLEEHAPNDPRLKAQARRFSDGTVHVVDQRTPPPMGDAAPTDFFGSFHVTKGEIDRRSYKRNDHHRLLSEAGFFKLGPKLHPWLVRSLTETIESSRGSHHPASS